MAHTAKACIQQYGLLERWWSVEAEGPGDTGPIWFLCSSWFEAEECCAAIASAGATHITLGKYPGYPRQRWRRPNHWTADPSAR